MQFENEEIIITIVVGTFMVLFFAVIIVFLISIFKKKKELHLKEKEMLTASFHQAILQSQLETQEHTFNSISREIHDNVGQILSLVKVQLNILDENETQDKTILKNAKENVSRAMTELREIAIGLNSERLNQTDLLEAVKRELDYINKSRLFNVSVKVNGVVQKIYGQKKVILFRIIQESFQNIIKHAHASAVGVIFNYNPNGIEIIINDNGQGFNMNETRNTGLGLQNIINRTSLIGGSAAIKSQLNEGTNITIIVPYA
jgi:signal transduction histidine kinase